ncbi:MAG: TFIIB-type zinc ribbon-containing protein [Clostridiales bacterium]|nr:TFIIB-type zinc ribbon-containing protein [Clostridiales bacterium]
MAVISLKCPNCDGELVFEPSTQQYECPYCGSDFTQEQVDQMQPQEQPSRESGTADFAGAAGGIGEGKTEGSSVYRDGMKGSSAYGDGMEENGAYGGEAEENTTYEGASGEETREGAVVYTCPSCGAEIVTDETTAATFCYYCHNPVVLSGRVSGEYLPEWIIPFRIDRKKAESMFLENVKKKKFIPKGFFSAKQIEKLSGVYFPYWMVDWQGRGRMKAKATKVRVWRSGDTEYTETRFYNIYREGTLEFPEMSRTALKKANRILVEGVQPYEQKDAKPFSLGYLSGFQAEKRDMEQQEFQQEIHSEIREYTEKMLRSSIQGYTTVTPQNTDARTDREEWDYVLVPVWVLTYRGRNGKMYYYAINGQTGKVCGELPVDYSKVGVVSAIISAAVFALGLVGGFLI